VSNASKENSSGDKVSKTGVIKQGTSLLRKSLILASQQYNRAEKTGQHLIAKKRIIVNKDSSCSKNRPSVKK